MSTPWIAVVRGLNCFSLSISLNIIAFWLTITAFIFLFLQLFMGPKGVMLPLEWLLLPAAVIAAIGFLYSQVGRLMLLRVPYRVPSAKFYALAGLFFGLVGQMGIGVCVTLHFAGIKIEPGWNLLLVGLSLAVAILGRVCVHQSLCKIANALHNQDAVSALGACRSLSYFGTTLLVIGGAILGTSSGGAGLVVLVVFGLSGFGVLGFSISVYSSALQSLRFSALREAVFTHD